MKSKEGGYSISIQVRRKKIIYFEEMLTATFSNQTQSEYYGSNRLVPIEGIYVEDVLEKKVQNLYIEIVRFFIYV